VLLDIGSGQRRLREGMINLDLFPLQNVDIVADAHHLPFRDSSVDGIHCDAVLEHVQDPYIAVQEMSRVLRRGGMIIAWVPFIAHYHPVPSDFHRFTVSGTRNLFSDFQEIELIVGPGPSSAVADILRDYLINLLSFGHSKIRGWLYVLLGWLFLPWKYVDVVARWQSYRAQAHSIAAGFLYVGRR